MAEENTITTIFKANIDQFSASAQDMRRYMGLVNAEFKEATAGLGKFSDSTDGLKAKLNQLDGILAVNKKKLAELEKQYSAMSEEQRKNSVQGQKLATEILKQRAEVKSTEKQINDYTKSLQDLEKAGVNTTAELNKLNKATKETGNEAKNTAAEIAKGIGKGIAALGAAVLGTATAFLKLAESTRAYRKEQSLLQIAFNQAGFNAEETTRAYARFNAILGDTAGSTEALQQLANITNTEEELNEYIDILTGAFSLFGKSIPTKELLKDIALTIQTGKATGNLSKALQLSGQELEAFNKQLELCNDEQERNALVQKTLSGIFKEAGVSYQANNKNLIDAEQAQIELTQATAELGAIAEPLTTTLKKALADLLKQIKPLVNIMANGLQLALNKNAEGTKKLAEGLSEFINLILNKFLELLPSFIDILVKFIPEIIKTILKATPSIIKALIGAEKEIINALVEIIPELIPILIKEIPTIIGAIIEGILKSIPEFAKAGLELLKGLFKGLLDPRAILDGVKNLGKSILNGIKSVFGIKSPSRVFKDQIGKNLALGIGVGFKQEIKKVEKTMQDSIGAITPDLGIQTPTTINNNNNDLINQLANILNGRKGSTTNNYAFNYTFEKMESSKLALHKAVLATKRDLEGR